jgi:predicted anti-sigma-YlaC factor YlaD
VTEHISEDDLTLYYYGEGRRRDVIERHIDHCAACSTLYRDIAGTLAMLTEAETPERGEQYGAEVWQRLRHKLPEKDARWWTALLRWERLALVGAAAVLVVAAFVAGRVWPHAAESAPGAVSNAPLVARGDTGSAAATAAKAESAAGVESRQRILYTSVADHLDRSERMLTDIMNTAGHADISTEQRWASDLLDTSRLYRQDAVDAGEQSVAGVLDELERSLLEIVHSPSRISAADLEQMRRRIDAAALLFKVRVMSDELRQREQPPALSAVPRTSTRKVS